MISNGLIMSWAKPLMELNMLVFVLVQQAHHKTIGSDLPVIQEAQESELTTPFSTLGLIIVRLSLTLVQYRRDGRCQSQHECI